MKKDETMPAKDGRAGILLADGQSDMTLCATRVLILTAHGGPEARSRFSEAGVRYLETPLESSPLRRCIRDLVALFAGP